MSVGRNLQEMENVVTKGAAPAEPMSTIAQNASGVMIPGQTGAWEDLGGPTPQNYRPDDDSATLKTPGATLAQVRNVVNAKAAAAEPMPTMAKEEVDEEELPKLDGAPIDENAQKIQNGVKLGKAGKVGNYQSSVLARLYK